MVDRDTSIVVPKSRPARVHDPVAALLGALRIRPIVLLPRRPESKGQVERTIGYLERSFLPLRSFEAIADVQAQHDRWAQEVAFDRHHHRDALCPPLPDQGRCRTADSKIRLSDPAQPFRPRKVK